MAADRLVRILLAEHDQLVVRGQAVRMVRQIAAADAYRMYLRNIFGRGHKSRHRPERFPRVVHVQTGHDDTHPVVGQLTADIDDARIEELRLVYTTTSTSDDMRSMFCGDSTGVERMAWASCDTTSSSE